MLDKLWLIPAVPLIGVVVNGFFGRRLSRRLVGWVACGVVLASFVMSLAAVGQLAALPEGERPDDSVLASWMPMGQLADGRVLSIDWGFALDPLSAVMILVVTGVGLLIHIYSIGYMSHEPDVARFFVYMNLFMAMMLTLVLGNNLLVMFVGWEGVGLCSYLLIGFFYEQPFDKRTGLTCADAGRKAFITNRIGDFAFLIGVLYLIFHLGTVNFAEISAAIEGGEAIGHGVLVAVGILLFIGAAGKSAQIPLYVWLPDAMAGPTPVSALIHAATMVTAGVYMVCRMSALYSHAPEAAAVVATVGALTAIFAASMGLTATDIKKVLAYSTVSQLGYMFAAAGIGAYTAAMFHLTTHAFFKALLFLGAGSVIHGLHGQQDIMKMGGLKSKMPQTFIVMLLASIAIAGIFPFAGFFSKDEILWEAFSGGHKVVWAVLVVAAVMTAFYMFRMMRLVFWGEHRGDAHAWDQAHESPPVMMLPLWILAVLSVFGGWLNVPHVLGFLAGAKEQFLHHWLAPALSAVHGAEAHAAAAAIEFGLMGLAIALAASGILAAWVIYKGLEAPRAWAARSGPLYPLLKNLYWVDELYDLAILRPFYRLSRVFGAFDRWVVDGLVNATGIVTDLFGQLVKLMQTGYVRNYAFLFMLGVLVVLAWLSAQ